LGVMRGLRVGRRVDLGLVVFMPQRTDGPLPSSLETQIRRKFGGIPQVALPIATTTAAPRIQGVPGHSLDQYA